MTLLKKDDIGRLGVTRTKEWLLYHKWQILKCSNDLIFNRARWKTLKLHLDALKNDEELKKMQKASIPEQEIPADEVVAEPNGANNSLGRAKKIKGKLL